MWLCFFSNSFPFRRPDLERYLQALVHPPPYGNLVFYPQTPGMRRTSTQLYRFGGNVTALRGEVLYGQQQRLRHRPTSYIYKKLSLDCQRPQKTLRFIGVFGAETTIAQKKISTTADTTTVVVVCTFLVLVTFRRPPKRRQTVSSPVAWPIYQSEISFAQPIKNIVYSRSSYPGNKQQR